jgi:hypothetical protein
MVSVTSRQPTYLINHQCALNVFVMCDVCLQVDANHSSAYFNLSKPSSYLTYHKVQHSKILSFAYTVYLPYTTLIDWCCAV